MKKFLIPILVAGVLSSFATTTNVVYIDVNNLQDFEIQMSPETGETNVINFKVYQDRSALDLSGLTPVLYAARDEAISRNVITIEGSSSGNVATITTAGVNLSQGMSELYLRLDFRSGKNPSKYTYPYRVKGKMLILENPITQTGDPVLIGELYFATAAEGDLAITALQTNDVGSAAFAAVEDFAAATLTNNVSALEAGTNTWNSAVQPEDLNSASNYLHGATIGYAQQLGFSITPKIISTIPVYPLEAYTDVTGSNAGSMIIEVDGVSTTTLGIDLGAATNYEHVAALLQDRLDFLIPTITITYSETGPAWTMDIGDTNATHIDEVRGYALSGVDDIAWLFGWSSTNNPVVVDGVGYITTAVQPEDLGTAAFSNSTDFVSSSVDNLTAWDSTEGGVVVSNVPSVVDGSIARWEYPTAFGSALGVWHFDGGLLLINSVDPLSGPNISPISSGGEGKFGQCAKLHDHPKVYPQSNFTPIDQNTDFSIEYWMKLIDNYAQNVTLNSHGVGKVFSLSKNTKSNEWQHFSFNYNGQTHSVSKYINGELVSFATYTGSGFTWNYGDAGSYIFFACYMSFIDDLVIKIGPDSLRTSEFTPPTLAYGSVVPPPRLQASTLVESNLAEAVNLANTALQTNDVGSAAFAETTDFATAAEGETADAALPRDGSKPMTGDLDMDGYDIEDAGIVSVDGLKMNPPSGSYMSAIQMPLTLATDVKCGYIGNGDFIGAADGVGFYAVASTDTNKFSLTYLTTNNYIMVQSPLIHATSNYIEKITGFGTCTSDNFPVAGLSVGDNYVTFAHSGTIGRTNLVTYTRFGSNIATVSPSEAWTISSINLHIAGRISSGGLDKNENINVFLFWGSDLTNPASVKISSMMRADYPTKDFVDVRNYKNQLIMFGIYHTNPTDTKRIERKEILCAASAISRSATITSN